MYYGLEGMGMDDLAAAEMGQLGAVTDESWIPSENPPPAAGTDWSQVAASAAGAAKDIANQYIQLQAAKAAIKGGRQPRPQVQVPGKQVTVTATEKTSWTPWIIGGVALAALVGGGVFFMKKKKAQNPGSKGWRTIGG